MVEQFKVGHYYRLTDQCINSLKVLVPLINTKADVLYSKFTWNQKMFDAFVEYPVQQCTYISEFEGDYWKIEFGGSNPSMKRTPDIHEYNIHDFEEVPDMSNPESCKELKDPDWSLFDEAL